MRTRSKIVKVKTGIKVRFASVQDIMNRPLEVKGDTYES